MASEWCWAASTEMISTYYHNQVNANAPIITQCQEVQQYMGSMCTIDCNALPDTITASCNWQSTPFAAAFGYSIADTNIALSWEALSTQITSGKPVAFEWNWTGITTNTTGNTGGHYLVAEGCPHSSYISFHGWVSVNDPLPVGIGRHRIMSYAEYRNLPSIDFPGYTDYAYNSHGYDFHSLNFGGN